jgi:hypothetical protein
MRTELGTRCARKKKGADISQDVAGGTQYRKEGRNDYIMTGWNGHPRPGRRNPPFGPVSQALKCPIHVMAESRRPPWPLTGS